MKSLRTFIISFATAILATVSITAEAGGRNGHHRGYHGHHGHHGWVAPLLIGAGVTYVLTRPSVVYSAPQPPVVYVESQPAPQPQYWYFCKERNAYHPHVASCPSAWMLVVPH